MANPTADPRLPNLPESPDPNDPLNRMGYQEESNAEQRLAINENDSDQGVDTVSGQTPLDTLNDVLDMGEDVKDTVNQVKDLKEKFGKKPSVEGLEEAATEGTAASEGAIAESAGTTAAKSGAKKAGATAAKGGAEKALEQEAVQAGRTGWLHATRGKIAEGQAKIAARQAARKTEQAAAKQAGKQLGKAAAKYGTKAAARWAAEAASGLADAGLSWLLLAADLLVTAAYAFLKKYGKYIVVGAAVLITLPGLIFFLVFASIGATKLPGSDLDRQQVQLASAFAGDVFETRQVTTRIIDSEVNRYGVIKENLKEFATGAPSDASAQADRIIAKLKELRSAIGTKNKTETAEMVNAMVATKRAFEAQLPFGEWSARAAEELAKLPAGTCPVAPGANANLGCASFASYVLIKAGIPQPHTAATITIWQNPNLSVVVPNQTTKNANYYAESKAKLQRGDVVWWGYGICGRNKRRAPGGLHCHVGIYLGNDEVVDNHSGKAVRSGGIAPVKHAMSGHDFFNGAKRYAPTP